MTSANDFLMAGGVPSAKFSTIGTTVSGTIARPPELQQQTDFETGALKYWDDGSPRQQVKVILATSERDPGNPEDDGLRALYLRGNLLKVMREAIRKSGAKGLEVGGFVSVTYVADGEPTRRGAKPPKEYGHGVYTPPAAAAANGFLAAGGEQPAPAPAPVAPQAYAPAAPVVQQQAPVPAAVPQAPMAAPVAAPAPAPAAPAGLPAGIDPTMLAALQQNPELLAALKQLNQ